MVYLIPFIEVPLKQYQLHDDPKFIGKFLREFFSSKMEDNYFYIPYTLYSSWEDDCCPLYLKRIILR